MIIEILYPDIANLYGDHYNIKYLSQSGKDCRIITTSVNDTPYFCDNKIDVLYLGPMSEVHQELAIDRLNPYKKQLQELIENDTVVLVIGNALEVFGTKIIDGNREITGLALFEHYAKRNFQHRHNSLFLGKYNDLDIVGYKSQFSQSYNNSHPFIEVINGCGLNKEDKFEGIHYRNFFGSYLLGPLLITNPLFTKELLRTLNQPDDLAYEKAALAAYNQRLKEYQNLKSVF